ncbi:MAG: 30S ribosomal protein S3 [Candidatus Micrarchaeaceae archaeon]
MKAERAIVDDSISKLKITRFIEQRLGRAGIANIEIQKTPVITRITIYTKSPGKVIGRGGETITNITKEINEKFGISNAQINVNEIENEWLEPKLVARFISDSFEKGLNKRRILHYAVMKVMQNGALGVEIAATGMLAGKGVRSKQIKIRLGYLPKAGNVTNLVKKAKLASNPKFGIIGIKVSIVPPGTEFPDRTVKKVEIPKSLEAGAS